MTDLENKEASYKKLNLKYKKHVLADMNLICLVWFDDSTHYENRINRADVFNADGSMKISSSECEVGYTGERKYTLDELKSSIQDVEKAIEWRKKTYGR